MTHYMARGVQTNFNFPKYTMICFLKMPHLGLVIRSLKISRGNRGQKIFEGEVLLNVTHIFFYPNLEPPTGISLTGSSTRQGKYVARKTLATEISRVRPSNPRAYSKVTSDVGSDVWVDKYRGVVHAFSKKFFDISDPGCSRAHSFGAHITGEAIKGHQFQRGASCVTELSIILSLWISFEGERNQLCAVLDHTRILLYNVSPHTAAGSLSLSQLVSLVM